MILDYFLAILLTFSLFATNHYVWAQSFNQSITLYRGYDCKGQKFDIGTKVSTMFDWNDAAYSVAITGAWLFYEHADFNQGSKSAMEYGFSSKSTCQNFIYVGGILSSARYVGDRRNYKKNSLTLYKSMYFQEDEEYSIGDRETLELKQHQSLIITGTSAWTLYDESYHEGNAVCLFPKTASDYSPFFLYDLKKNIDVPYDSIRSIRLGCFGSKTINTDRFASASHGGLNGTLQ